METADADKLMKQANKHCDPSFFSMRIKADWEQAQPLYERAAKIYKVRICDVSSCQHNNRSRYCFDCKCRLQSAMTKLDTLSRGLQLGKNGNNRLGKQASCWNKQRAVLRRLVT